jgi:type II secretory pathway pseudopilin PulG
MHKQKRKYQFFIPLNFCRSEKGFSLVECVFTLLVLTVGSLSIISVFNYSLKNNSSAKKRFGALLLAQQRLENVRNTAFANISTGTTTENSVINDGVPYKVVSTVADNDLLVVSTAPGPETKKITITVSPVDSSLPNETVSLVTFRAANRPGPNREPNVP